MLDINEGAPVDQSAHDQERLTLGQCRRGQIRQRYPFLRSTEELRE